MVTIFLNNIYIHGTIMSSSRYYIHCFYDPCLLITQCAKQDSNPKTKYSWMSKGILSGTIPLNMLGLSFLIWTSIGKMWISDKCEMIYCYINGFVGQGLGKNIWNMLRKLYTYIHIKFPYFNNIRYCSSGLTFINKNPGCSRVLQDYTSSVAIYHV